MSFSVFLLSFLFIIFVFTLISSSFVQVIDGVVNITDKFALNSSSSQKPKLHTLVSSLLDFLCKSNVPESKVDPIAPAFNVNNDRATKVLSPGRIDAADLGIFFCCLVSYIVILVNIYSTCMCLFFQLHQNA